MKQSAHIRRLLMMADSSASGHPTGGRRCKHKSPAVVPATDLPLPCLRDELDKSSDGDVENDAKRPRSTSTTPKLRKDKAQMNVIDLWESARWNPVLKKIGTAMGN